MSHFYSKAQWRRLRRLVLAESPLCVDCLSRGIRKLAEEVDHIQPMSQGGDAWDMDNLQPLCKPCHSVKTSVDTGKRATMPGCTAEGVPLDVRHAWHQTTSGGGSLS